MRERRQISERNKTKMYRAKKKKAATDGFLVFCRHGFECFVLKGTLCGHCDSCTKRIVSTRLDCFKQACRYSKVSFGQHLYFFHGKESGLVALWWITVGCLSIDVFMSRSHLVRDFSRVSWSPCTLQLACKFRCFLKALNFK